MNAESPTPEDSQSKIQELLAKAQYHKDRSAELENGIRLSDLNNESSEEFSSGYTEVIEGVELPKNWESKVRILKSKARTIVTQNEHLTFEQKQEKKDYIDSIEIIPDGQTADAHKNQMNISAFIRFFSIKG